MDEFNNNHSDYEPNFILKDTEQADNSSSSSSTEDTHNFTEETNAQSSTAGETYGNGWRAADSSDVRDADFTTHDNSGGGFTYQQDFQDTDALYNQSASWDSRDGQTRKRIKRLKKASTPISLTKRSLALIIVLCLVVSAFFGFASAALANNLFGNGSSSGKSGSVSTSGYTLEDATGSNLTIQEISEKAQPSVVQIKTESATTDAWMQQYVTEGAGSGVVMTKDGYIMTNNHVISGANKITVTTYDNQEYSAEVIGADSTNDVAVLKIDADNLTAVTYGNSDQLSVGDLAVAIGNPLGKLGGTVTSGIISALDRQLTIDGKTMSLLQTDASINPGNSGGGLFNSDGQLIGLVVAKSSGSNIEGLGFAIPINTAADVAQQLKDNGYVSGQPTSGMSYTEATSQSMADFFTGATQSAGVYIYEVTGSNAKKAGFQSGDLVYAIDDTVISSSSDVTSIITSHEVGDKLTYTIVRGNQTKTIKLTLEEKKSDD